MESFSALLAICAGNSPVTGEFPAQRPVTSKNGEAGDLRRYRAHCDVTVMIVMCAAVDSITQTLKFNGLAPTPP